MLAIFFSASEYAYNMLRFFRNFSLNMHIVVMLIKKKGVHILANISRSKVNQSVKFGQLIEYNMRRIFVEKSHTTCGRETSQTLIYKIKIEHIFVSIV